MTNKATHQGECQVCGRVQKLPGGELAKHGYTIEWSMFTGTCFGSHHLPFEQDKSLVDEAIKRATMERNTLQVRIEALTANKTPSQVYVHYYCGRPSVKRVGTGYAWAKVPSDSIVEAEGVTSHSGQWVAEIAHVAGAADTRTYTGTLGYAHSPRTATIAAYESNARYVRQVLEPMLEAAKSFIAWQTRRLRDWAPKPLKPIT